MKKDCYNYVNLKYAIDDKLQQQVDANMIYSSAPLEAVNPMQFVLNTLPFISAEIISGTLVSTQVDPFSVVGGTFNIYSSIDESAELCKNINKEEKMNQILVDAHYYKIGDMPLYIAMEGKNRVQLFRKFNISINCNVSTLKYPKANELKIHEVSFRKNLFFISCSNSEFYRHQNESVKQIVFPEHLLPLLLNYGVEYGKRIMKPFSTPNEGKIIKRFSEHGYRMS